MPRLSFSSPPELLAQMTDFAERTWLLEKVREWLFQSDDRLFILSGDPGVGKSTFCTWLLGAGPDPLDEGAGDVLNRIRQTWSAAYFCSSRLRSSSLDPRDFARSLSRQLAVAKPKFDLYVMRGMGTNITSEIAVNENLGSITGINIDVLLASGRTALDSYALSVREPMIAYLEGHPDETIAILVDGLDEAATFLTPNIYDLIKDSAGLPSSVKLFVTTRNDDRVLGGLIRSCPDASLLNLSSAEFRSLTDRDIREFIRRSPKSIQISNATEAAIVQQAEGNFLYVAGLLDQLSDGRLAESGIGFDVLPSSLTELYDRLLGRLMEIDSSCGAVDEAWLTTYEPVLGCLAVAFSPVGEDVLAAWTGIRSAELRIRFRRLSQLVTFDAEAAAYRLNHGALQSFFLTTSMIDARPNVFKIDATEQHARIASYYLAMVRDQGWLDVDEYGLRHLLEHLAWLIRISPDERSHQRYTSTVVDLLASDEYLTAMTTRVKDATARSRPYRIGLELLIRLELYRDFEILVHHICHVPDVFVRSAAMDVIDGYASVSLTRTEHLVELLLSSENYSVQLSALRVAANLDPSIAERIFSWILANGSKDLRDSAAYALYLNWVSLSQERIHALLFSLARNMPSLRPRIAARRLEFISNVTITNFIAHGDDDALFERISELWKYVFTRRLGIRLISKPSVERLISPVLARHLAGRVLDAAMTPELQDPARFFLRSHMTSDLVRRMIPYLDPASAPRSRPEDILTLLESELIICRVLAMQILAVHSFVDFDGMRAWLEDLFENGSGRSRIWQTLAFGVLAHDTPPTWLPLVEKFTSRIIEENRGSFDDFDGGTLLGFDAVLVPVGIAYGKMSVEPRLLAKFVQSRDSVFRSRVLHGIGMVGLYYPNLAMDLIMTAYDEGAAGRGELVNPLSIFYPLHPGTSDMFLAQHSLGDLRPEIAAAADYNQIRLYIDRIGHYNNGINEAVRWPIMRRGFLEPVYQLIVDSHTSREFLERYIRIVLSMLREADYTLIKLSERWAQD